ncbi:glycosyltransferase [Geomonas oryzisoli]|uniref:Glycosyltransferase n=1 Tax=Geomonas oryzisoli TaxID=2847992 RepID=A0ABX8J5V9_9BACT|nr:glycosyltransferase [Geomonas oryzisoli]QWV92461.1 glycosyltransferase [Geomonas oryzisoli]
MLVSVVICTYNRSELLEAALRSVISQDFPLDRFEVVVVDNNSTDDTRERVAAISSGAAVKTSYVFVEKQGLSYARNAGIEASSGEIVVFTDDDIEADRYWLSNLVDAFTQPEVCCAGGPLKPLWLHPRPEWLVDELLPAIAISDFPAAELGEFKSPSYPWGANIAFRKRVFQSIGMFPTDLGRVGTRLLSNEEIFLCRRIVRNGLRIAFAEKAVIYHKVPPSRLTKNYFLHRYSNQGASDAILDTVSDDVPYRRIQQLFLSLKNNDASKFAVRCFLRSVSAYLIQLASLAEAGAVRLDAVRLIHSAMKTVADRSETDALQKELQDRTVWALQLKEAVTARDETVRSLQTTVEQRTAWAQSVTKELEQRDSLIQSLQQELQDRTAWALELTETVAVRDETVRSLKTALDERTTWALNIQEELQQRDIVILGLQHELSDRTTWSLCLKAELEQSSTRLQALQQEFADRTAWALELNDLVAAQGGTIRMLQETIDERTAWARKLEDESGQKDSMVRALQEEIAQQTGWALALKAETEQQESIIESLRQELDERTAWALALKGDLEQRVTAVQSLQQELDERTAWALALKDDLEQRVAAVQSLQQKVREQNDCVDTLKAELDRELMLHREEILEKARHLETELASKESLNELLLEKNRELQRLQMQWDAERAQLTQELSANESRVESLLNSMSWKITSPLRSIYSVFTKKS